MFTTETREVLKLSTVFLIDDNSIIYNFISSCAPSIEYFHIVTKDKKCVKKEEILESKAKIIFMHIDDSNIEFLKELKSDSVLKDIPVICWVKKNNDRLIKKCFMYGCADCGIEEYLNIDVIIEKTIFHLGMAKLFYDKEKTIRELEQLRFEFGEMENIVDSSPVIAFVCLINEKFEVVYASRGVIQFGYEPEEFYDETISWADMIYEEDKKKIINQLKTEIQKGETKIFQEYRINTKKKGIRWTEARLTIEKDVAGVPEYVKGILIDITDRKALEGEILSQQNMLFAVLDAMPCSIFWKDKKMCYQGCNKKESNILGLNNPDDIIGLTDFDLNFTKENAEYFRTVDEKILKTGESRVGVVDKISNKDGTYRWVETNKVPLFDEKCEISGIVGAYTDITEKKKQEEYSEQVRKMDAIAKLTSGLVHDFKNMLMMVSGYIQMLEVETNKDKKKSYFKKTTKILESSENLLTKIMGFSREERDTEMVEVDIDDFIKNVMDLFEGTIKEKIKLKLNSKVKMKINQSVLTQMMVNLIINANKAIVNKPDGNIVIETEKDFGLILKISDNGCGIDKQFMNNMFEPFVTTEGTGLGLYIVWEAVKLHNGKIFCESEADNGTTFTIVLPII